MQSLINRPARFTMKEIVAELRKTHPMVQIIDKTYTNYLTKMRCRCKRHKIMFTRSWHKLRRWGCPQCAIEVSITKRKLPGEKAAKLLRAASERVEFLESYTNTVSKILCKCRRCNHKWRTALRHLNNGHGCPRCAFERVANSHRLDHTTMLEKLALINPRVKVVGKYVSSLSPLDCMCLDCNHAWQSTWNRLQAGKGCPECGSDCKSEGEVRAIFEQLTGKKWPRANPSEVPFLNGLHADGFCRELNAIFEFDGAQHKKVIPYFHGKTVQTANASFLRQRRRDWRKNYQCWYHGVKLIRVSHRVRNKEACIKTRLIRAGLIM